MVSQLLAKTVQRESLLLELGKALLKIGAIRFGSFKTHEGKFSPYYLDLRAVGSFPSVMKVTLSCLSSVADSIDFSHVCGVPISGAIFGALLANSSQKPFLYTVGRRSLKMHGQVNPGSRVLVIDDVSESGKSMEHAIQTIRANSGVVEDALVVIDRSEGAIETLKAMGVKLHYFATIHELAERLKESMALTEEEVQLIETKPGS